MTSIVRLSSMEESGGSQSTEEKDISSDDEMVAGCFDFRLRTRSFDLHQLAQRQKRKKFGLLFKFNSETDVKTCSNSKNTPPASPSKNSPRNSPRNSPQSSPGSARRSRFIRVLRNARDPDLENPHVVHRFSQDFLEQSYERERSTTSSSKGGGSKKALPYRVTGHTILKRHATIDVMTDSDPELQHSPSVVNKHASFFDDVVVIEFDTKCKIEKAQSSKHFEKLNDDSNDAETTTGGGEDAKKGSELVNGAGHTETHDVIEDEVFVADIGCP